MLYFEPKIKVSVSISVASKWATFIGAVLTFVFFHELLVWTESPTSLPLALGIENLVFLNAISPLGLMSIVSAKHAIELGAWLWLSAGYGAALCSNLASYGLGRLLARYAQHKPPGQHSIPLTFWHPQLASLTAFAEGLRAVRLSVYLAHAVPWSIIWYTTASVLIYQLPAQIRSCEFASVGLVGLGVWL